MNTKILFITAFAVCMFFGCKQSEPADHVHESTGQAHTHEGEDATHSQEGVDATHTHEGEDQTHTHEGEAATHTQEGEDQTQTHEGEAATHTHAVDDTSHAHFYGEEEVEVITLKKQEFQDILKTTGVLLPSREDLQVYHAPANGFIHFTDKRMVPGSSVDKGEALFLIEGGILSEENSDLKFKEAQLDFEKEKKNFERAENLIDDKIISEEDFLEIKNNYQNAQNRYQLYLENRKQGGQRIISKTDGFIRQILVSEGDYVNAGDEVASAITYNKLILRADVSQDNYGKLMTFNSATFTTSYGYRVYRSEALGGKLLAYGRSTDETSFFTPITFEIDHHPDLIPGSFVEVNLKGKTIEQTIVIPKTALMEDQGRIYVFIKHENGEYEKHYIELGADDGEYVQVLAGLSEKQQVVIEGTYFVKLSTMATDLPASHSH